MVETLGFRAHARLLTMLGEQLIRNERVALVELVKNAYDADARRVTVDFRGFDPGLTRLPGAQLVITDDGTGMSEHVIRTAWMNPATPTKKLRKRDEPRTPLGRTLQGEKGIGRFAAFKLGSEVTVSSRAVASPTETTLVVDISMLDEGQDEDSAVNSDLYLEDIPALLDTGSPRVFAAGATSSSSHGTQLAVGKLRATWNRRLVQGAYEDLNRLRPLMWAKESHSAISSDFEVVFLRDGRDMGLGDQRAQEFEVALEHAVLQVRDGRFDTSTRTFDFTLNARPVSLHIDDAQIRGLKPFRDRFLRDGRAALPPDTIPHPACGPFQFEFFIFDLTASAPTTYNLDREQRELVKDNRIYLYRDGIRVYPYGDPDDDWLEIDIDRGTESAGRTFSNDQVVGHVEITQGENPQLRDKTSREGLIDSGPAVEDFKALIKTVLRYLRQQYQPYLDSKTRSRKQGQSDSHSDSALSALRSSTSNSAKVTAQLDALEKALANERSQSNTRLSRTEQLAGVGLSVETASHDLILAGNEALRTARQIVSELQLLDMQSTVVYSLSSQLVSRLEFISSRFQDVQGLFVSTRQRPSDQDVLQALRRVKAIYSRLHESNGIDFEIDSSVSLHAETTEAALLQLLINLVDNSTYWLMSAVMPAGQRRRIRAFARDGSTLILTDNGPGVPAQDAPYIFEPFYSGKGEEGKGLGLYIARQNGLRGGFSVELADSALPGALAGATFAVRFEQGASPDGDS